MKPLIVMKFGGTSLADRACQDRAVELILERKQTREVVVLVSAMGKETDRLAGLLAANSTDTAETDVLLAAGEQVSAALLAHLLQQKGQAARSFMGWQVPIETTADAARARITHINPDGIKKTLAQNKVPVIAGFQGIDPAGRITTLGRGGSDTSAVAVAIALKAAACEIYTDVEGVFTSDPQVVDGVRCLTSLSYEEMLELASLGAKVLQTRSVALAQVHQMPVRVLPSHKKLGEAAGTLICSEAEKEQNMEQQEISGIAHSKMEAKITLSEVADRPGVAAQIFAPLSAEGVLVDMIVQSSSLDNSTTDITFTLSEENLSRALKLLEGLKDKLGYKKCVGDKEVGKVSVIGVGMRSQSGVASTMFSALSDAGVNIQAISTSEIKISVLVKRAQVEQAVQVLHTAYGLEKK